MSVVEMHERQPTDMVRQALNEYDTIEIIVSHDDVAYIKRVTISYDLLVKSVDVQVIRQLTDGRYVIHIIPIPHTNTAAMKFLMKD